LKLDSDIPGRQESRGRGRPKGTKNRPGHKAGHPKNQARDFISTKNDGPQRSVSESLAVVNSMHQSFGSRPQGFGGRTQTKLSFSTPEKRPREESPTNVSTGRVRRELDDLDDLELETGNRDSATITCLNLMQVA
jgi:hypothetical protein